MFDYKQTTVDEALSKLVPDGVDLYYDNVSSGYSIFVSEFNNFSQ